MKPGLKGVATVMAEIKKILMCSTENITREDGEVFRKQSRMLANNVAGRWVWIFSTVLLFVLKF